MKLRHLLPSIKPVSAPATYESVAQQRQAYFLYALGLIGLISILGNIINDFIHNLPDHKLDLVILFALLAFYVYILRVVRQGKIAWASTLVAFFGGIGYFLLGYNDQAGNAGLFLFTTYPILAFFLLGKHKGLIWTSWFISMMILSYGLSLMHVIELVYSPVALRDFVFAFGMTMLMIYIYQDMIDASERIVRNRDLELAHERDQAKATVTSIGEGIIVIDRRRRISSMNPVAERLLGIKPGKGLRKPLEDIFPLHSGRKKLVLEEHPALTPLSTGLATETRPSDTLSYHSTDGRHFPVSIVATPFKQESAVTGVVIAFRDVTQEKEASEVIEQKVREGRAQLLASINSLELGYIMTDASSSIAIVNNAAIGILERAELLDSKTAREMPLRLETLQKILGKNINLVGELERCLANRSSIDLPDLQFGKTFLKIFISPIILKNEAIGTVVLIEDITEAKVLERSRDEFFAIASHELRTPVAAIRGYLESIRVLHPKILKDAELEHKLSILQESSDRLKTIIDDFLDLSRLEQGEIEFQRITFDIENVVRSVIDEVSYLAKAKNLHLKVAQEKVRLPLVSGDPERAKQVLLNLVSNAIKFTDNGQIVIHLRQLEGDALIEVEDSGKGIPLANQSLLFHKFQQAGSSFLSRDISGGTGLGLYISKLIVQAMDGKIFLEGSVPGKGSIFAFTLPLAKR